MRIDANENVSDLFSEKYSIARAKFLAAAKATSAAIMSRRHPTETGPEGEPLFIDACRLGGDEADVVLLTLSGTHGGEGYAGSAVQTCVLQSGISLPPGVAVVHVHAVNPFGMAHFVRTNENNVDLNRNWIDFTAPPPVNPLFDEIFDRLPMHLAPKIENVPAVARAYQAQVRRYGRWSVDDALSAGQYHRSDAVGFGGVRPEWSRIVLEELLPELIGQARHIAYVDWHTLVRIGDGKIVYLCFNETGGHLFDRAASWWGRSNIDRATVNRQWKVGSAAADRRPSRHGLAMWGIERALAPSTDVAGAVVEFSTEPHASLSGDELFIFEQLCERYLQSSRDLTSPTGEAAVAALREATCPAAPRFRLGAIEAGLGVYRKTLQGAHTWAQEDVAADPDRPLFSSEFV